MRKVKFSKAIEAKAAEIMAAIKKENRPPTLEECEIIKADREQGLVESWHVSASMLRDIEKMERAGIIPDTERAWFERQKLNLEFNMVSIEYDRSESPRHRERYVKTLQAMIKSELFSAEVRNGYRRLLFSLMDI